jgi:hypothetical protein
VPNRIVREGIITSEPVNSLNWAEEVFYRRLHSVVDDYGRYHANLSLLRAALYPLLLNKVSDSDVAKWLQATEKAGLVRVYEVDGKRYLEVLKFGQRQRADKSRFPEPTNDGQMTVKRQTSAAVVVDVVVNEDEGVSRSARQGSQALPDGFEIFWTAYPKRAGNNPKDKAAQAYKARVAEGHTPAEILDGAGRYAAFCRQTGKEGTEFVMQAKTFLGPSKGFAQDWVGPAPGGRVYDYEAVQRQIEEEEKALAKH